MGKLITRIDIAALIVPGLYAEIGLWACKHAHAQTYRGEAIHKTVIAFCIGSKLNAPPCAPADIGFVYDQRRVHFPMPVSDADICAILHRLGYP